MSDKNLEKAEKLAAKALAKQQKEQEKAQKSEVKKAESAKRRQELEARVQQRKEDKAAKVANDLQNFGNEIAKEYFGSKTVRFFSKGYVSISTFGSGTPEKLIDITTNADISKKSGLGRAVVGVATFGLNIGATSNMRGDIYISIVTSETTHMLHVTPPSESSVKTARKIEATGKGLLIRLDAENPGDEKTKSSVTPKSSDLTQQLSTLNDLHASGVLSDAEFAKAKAKLLD